MNTGATATDRPVSWRVVIGLDGSEGSRRALGYASRLARSLGAKVIGVHVVDTTTYTSYPGLMLAVDEEALKRFQTELEGSGASPFVSQPFPTVPRS